MEFKKKPQSSVLQRQPQMVQAAQPAPEVQRHALIQRDLQRHTSRPGHVQRQVADPALKAAALHTAEVQRLSEEQTSIQRQAAEMNLPQSAVDAALQRQQAVPAPVPTKPQSISDWVTVMRFQAEQSEGRRMGAKEASQFTALQRQVAQTMSRSYLTDRQSALQRQQDYAGHVVALQRHPVSGQVARAFMLSVPQGERAALQRAVDEAQLNELIQRQQDEQALKLHTLQRQLAELDQQATQPVFERIQQRRGAGNPLPEAVQRHLEQGLNHDLSAVRIHDDAEADKLAKGVNAIAFTTGTDIYFQSGKFNPNSQSGLELLAHEVTHTVQQSKGQVGKGIDPDSGMESEAQAMGRKLAKKKFVRNKENLKAPLYASQGMGGIQRSKQEPTQSVSSTPLPSSANTWDTFRTPNQGDYCRPYDKNDNQITKEKDIQSIYTAYMPLAAKLFGPEVAGLYLNYLHGDLSNRVNLTQANYPQIYKSFDQSPEIKEVLEMLSKIISISNIKMDGLKQKSFKISEIVSQDRLNDLSGQLDFSDKFSIPGNLVGGTQGGSDYGKDKRVIDGIIEVKVSGDKMTYKGNVIIKIYDGIDFCPGNPGAGAEKWVTVPMSRLEASGVAKDVGLFIEIHKNISGVIRK